MQKTKLKRKYRRFKKKVNQGTKAVACRIVSQVKTFAPDDNILLCCNPRGGSTWLMNLIGLIPKTVILWEPLHPRVATAFKALGFTLHQYIPEDAVWKDAENTFLKLFSGKLLNTFVCSISHPHQFLSADKMIIKFCRANAMLPWLTANFDFQLTPIYLVRHPFAVIASQLKHGAWNHELSRFRIPECPFKDYYAEHAAFLSNIESREEVLIARWCLSNIIPLTSAHNNKKWITIYYENMLQDPAKEINRIFSRWGIDMPPHILDHVSKPSHTTKEATFLKSVEHQLSKWKGFFNRQQVKKMEAVLDHFNVSHYDSKNIYPNL